MSGFDTVAVVDWSGGNDRGPRPKPDAIWIAVDRRDGAPSSTYHRNRASAEAALAALIGTERRAGRRLLIGFDFPFGYPAGFGRALTGTDDPFTVMTWFAERIEDAPRANNRFDIAGELNRALGAGKGPFWANGLARDINGLPRTRADYVNPFPERRACETRAKGSFTCWQMAGAGAVGSQVMMGLPVLARLRRDHGAQIWPFEPLTGDVALIEVWPSLTCGPAPDGMIKDDWQVRETARQIAALPADTLAQMLDVDAPVEGWIFGLGHEARLRAPAALRNDCFALPPGVHWTPAGEALELLRARMQPVTGHTKAAVSDALGRILAEPVIAARSHPAHPNTAVDGYGFAGGRDAGVHSLPLLDARAAAGDRPGAVPPGHAIRILTGAALPQGVDTVILQEDVEIRDGAVHFTGPVKAGANTRKAGEDMSEGAEVLSQGRVLTAADLALLTATGAARVSVHARLRVGVLSTGDELIDAGASAEPGQIYDANRPMLLAMAARWGHDAVDLGRAPDDRAALRAMLDAAATRCDVILTSGGASAGDEDHLSALLQDAGAMALWRIAIKPGRPLALGMWDGVPVFGLPGNPVAAMVCAVVFARPALSVLAGGCWLTPQAFSVPAGFEKRKKSGRREYLRARLRDGRAEVFASEGSGRVSGLSWAEGLIELDEDAADIRPGDQVSFLPWGSFGL